MDQPDHTEHVPQPMLPFAAMVAHQGGWDEALLIVLPLFGLAGLMLLANRRADRRLKDHDAVAPSEESSHTRSN